MSEIVYLGVKGSVVAVETATGAERWRTHLKGSGFVTVLVDDEVIVAHAGGHLFGLDPESGDERWHNDLPGLGYGLAMLATRGSAGQDVLARSIQQQRSRAAGTPGHAPGT
jgi:outer membrane protein assembly factor BamB